LPFPWSPFRKAAFSPPIRTLAHPLSSSSLDTLFLVSSSWSRWFTHTPNGRPPMGAVRIFPKKWRFPRWPRQGRSELEADLFGGTLVLFPPPLREPMGNLILLFLWRRAVDLVDRRQITARRQVIFPFSPLPCRVSTPLLALVFVTRFLYCIGYSLLNFFFFFSFFFCRTPSSPALV